MDHVSHTNLLGEEQPPRDKYQADFVLVFPRPPEEEGKAVQKFTGQEIHDFFDEILVSRDKGAGAADASIDDAYPCCTALEGKLTEAGVTVSLKELQDTVIEDMVSFLSDRGCWTEAFMSIDNDELFLLVSLGDPTKTAQEDLTALPAAQEMGLRLQTTFNKETLARIGIRQTLLPHAEAYMTYSKYVTEASVTALNFDEPTGTGQTLFKRYSSGIGGTRGSILRTVDRVRVLQWLLRQFMNLEDAKGCPILDDYYVPHNMSKLNGFRSGYENPEGDWDNAHAAWANFRIPTIASGLPLKTMFSTFDVLASVRASQPIEEIRNYFGEQIAFYFLWLSFTTQASFFALIPCCALDVCLAIFRPGYDADAAGAENDAEAKGFADRATEAQKTNAAMMAFFSLSAITLYCIGGTLYLKGWLRLQNYYRCLWDPAEPGATYGHRPHYVGEMVPSPIDENKRTKVYPLHKAACMRITSTTVVVIFVAATIATVVGVYRLRPVLVDDYGVSPKTAKTIVSLLFTVQITVFQLIWDEISPRLVEMTNPRTDENAKDLSVQFLFPFSFVSTYANIAFHAFYTDWGEECMTHNCMVTMRPALIAVVGPALALQVVSMLIPYAMYRYSLHAKAQAIVKKGGQPPERAFVESQSKRPTFETLELNTEMNIMVILLGYVMLFGFAAPIVSAFVFVAFLVKIRVDAFKLCSVYQRVTPQMQFTGGGIGEWNEVLKSLVKISHWTCTAVLVFNLRYFNLSGKDNWIVRLIHYGDDEAQLNLYQKAMLVFVFKELIDRITTFIDYAISDHSTTELLMNAKRGKVFSAFTAKLAAARRKAELRATPTNPKEAVEAAVKSGIGLVEQVRQNNVPRLSEKPGARENFNWKDFAVATDRETYLGR